MIASHHMVVLSIALLAAVGIVVPAYAQTLQAVPDYVETSEDRYIHIRVLDNDVSHGAHPEVTTLPRHGATHVNLLDNTIRYTPRQNYYGQDSFQYTIARDGQSSTATVTINVTAVNDRPWFEHPGSYRIDEGQTLNHSLQARDVDNDLSELVFTAPNAPPGTVITGNRLTWTPNGTQAGVYSFYITVRDPGGLSSIPGQMIIHVADANLPPVVQEIPDITDARPGVEIRFTVNAVDSDFRPDLRYRLRATGEGEAVPGGAELGDTTGIFTWTPTIDDAGNHTFTVRVWDRLNRGGGHTVDQSITITVRGLDAVDDPVRTNEDTPVNIRVLDNDIAGSGAPVVMTRPMNGNTTVESDNTITYTPDADYDEDDSFEYTITHGNQSSTATVTITVTPVNDAPVLKPIQELQIEGGQILNVTLNFTDIDNDDSELIFGTIGAPDGLTVSDGRMVWMPTEDQIPGNYAFNVTVYDGYASDSQRAEIAVEINPDTLIALRAIADQTIDEHRELTYTIPINNTKSQTITWSITPDDLGAAIDESGRFVWTPGEEHGGNTYPFDFTAAAATNTEYGNLSVTVTETNQNPEFHMVDTMRTATVGDELIIRLNATDADLPPQNLEYSLVGNDIGAGISGNVISWTPQPSHSEQSVNLTVEVQDDFDQPGTNSITIAIRVNPEPVADVEAVQQNGMINFTITSNINGSIMGRFLNPDGMLREMLDQQMLSVGQMVNWSVPQSGSLEFGQTYTYQFTRADDTDYTQTDAVNRTITIYRDISLASITQQIINEEETTNYKIPVNNLDGQPIEWSITSGQKGDATITPEGNFTWTPTEDDGHGGHRFDFEARGVTNTVTGTLTFLVREVDRPPIIRPIPNIDNAMPGEEIRFTVVSINPDNTFQRRLYFLEEPYPENANIHTTYGTFTWTPTVEQAGFYNITVRVREFGIFGLTSYKSFNITVVYLGFDIPQPPEGQNKIRINEQQKYAFNATVTNTDNVPYVFTLDPPPEHRVSGHQAPPAGAMITRQGGFSWTPSEAQGGITHTIYVYMLPEGRDPIVKQLRLDVMDVLHDPVIQHIPDIPDARVGSEIRFTVNATDGDGDRLRYVLDDPPAGAEMVRSTGLFTWTPTGDQIGSHTIKVRVWDGRPNNQGNTRQNFVVTVLSPLRADNAEFAVPINRNYLLDLVAGGHIPDDRPAGTLDVSISRQPAGGSIQINDTRINYTAPANAGTDYFEYTVTDASGANATGAVTVRIVSLAARDDARQTYEDTPIRIYVLENDIGPVIPRILTDPANGEAVPIRDQFGTWFVEYTPNQDYNGPDEFSYYITLNSARDTATVRVAVISVDDPPVITGLPAPAGPPIEIPAGVEYTFNATATDKDSPDDQITFGLEGKPAGAVINATTGVFSWTPTADQIRLHVFSVSATSGTHTVKSSLSLMVVPNTLRAVDDGARGLAGMLVITDVLANDIRAEGATVTIVDNPENGTAVVRDNNIWYRSNEGYAGTDSITYMADGTLGSDNATVTITMDRIEALDDTVSTVVGAPVTIDVLANDEIIDGVSLNIVSAPSGGTATVQRNDPTTARDDRIIYTATTMGDGTDTFTYRINRGAANETATVTVAILPGSILATEDRVVVAAGASVTIDVLANDAYLGNPTIDLTSSTFFGSAAVQDNRIVYDPRSYVGEDLMEYRITSGTHTDSARIYITVNQTAVLLDDAVLGASGAPVTIDVLANDLYPDTAELTLFPPDPFPRLFPSNGHAAVQDDGTILYTPYDGFAGIDIIEYTVNVPKSTLHDRPDSPIDIPPPLPHLPARAIITVESGSELTGVPAYITIDEEAPYSFDANVTGSNRENHVFGLEDAPAGAAIDPDTGVFSWEPGDDQNGKHNFTVTVTVDGFLTDLNRVHVTVLDVNPPPVIAHIPDIIGPVGEEIRLVINATDEETIGDGLRYNLEKPYPDGAVLNRTTGVFTWTPTREQTGNHTITVRVWDGQGANRGNTLANFTITVPRPFEAVDDEIPVFLNTPVVVNVLVNDPSTSGASVSVTQQPSNGTAKRNDNNTITYTPASDLEYTETFMYMITLGEKNDTATVTVTVRALNDDRAVTPEDTPRYIDVLTNDGIRDMGISSVTDPDHGMANITDSNSTILYTPDPNYNGPDSFDYAVEYESNTYTATVNVNVTSVADPIYFELPQPQDNIVINEGIPYRFNINFSNPDNIGHTWLFDYAPETDPPATFDEETGWFSWTPPIGHDGINVHFDLHIHGGELVQRMLVINVLHPNEPPTITPIDDISRNVNTPISLVVEANDTDISNQTLTYTLAGDVPSGARINPVTGEFRWTPGTEHEGNNTITVRVSDGRAHSEENFIIAVIWTNQPLTVFPETRSDDVGVGREWTYGRPAVTDDGHADHPDITYWVTGDVPEGLTILSSSHIDFVTPPTINYSSDPALKPENLTVTDDADHFISWTPTVEQHDSTHRFNIVFSDGEFNATTRFTVEVAPIQDLPENDRVPGRINTPLVVFPLGNDGVPSFFKTVYDIDGAVIAIFLASDSVRGGTVRQASDHMSILYTPPEGFTGKDVIEYSYWEEAPLPSQQQLPGVPNPEKAYIFVNVSGTDGTPPTLNPIEPKTVSEFKTLQFTASAPGSAIGYLLYDAPEGAAIDQNSGMFSWTPTEFQDGNYSLLVVAYNKNDNNNADVQEVAVTVREANQNPVLHMIQNRMVEIGDSLRFDVYANDTDSVLVGRSHRLQELSFSLESNSPPDASIRTITPPTGSTTTRGVFSWTPTSTGSYAFNITVTDSAGGSATQEVTVDVQDTTPPVIRLYEADQNPQIIGLGVQYRELGATVSDNDPNYAGNVTIDAPDIASNMEGNYTVTYSASPDNAGNIPQNVSRTVQVRILDSKLPPIAPSVRFNIDEDSGATDITPTAMHDPDGGPVYITGSTARGSIGMATYDTTYIIYTPDRDKHGEDRITYTVTDDEGETTTGMIIINVKPINDAPVLDTLENFSVTAGKNTSFMVMARDIDNDELIYSLVTGPQNATLTPDGQFSWTTFDANIGNHPVTIMVSDGQGGSDQATITIHVVENQPPTLRPMEDRTVPEGQPLQIRPEADDPEDDPLTYGLIRGTLPDAAIFETATGHLDWTPGESDGGMSHDIVITVSDGRGGSDSEDITITVRETNQNPVIMPVPQQTAVVGQQLTVQIMANDTDIPPQTLSYNITGDDLGADISGNVVTWTPDSSHLGSRSITVLVEDDYDPKGSATVVIPVTVSSTGQTRDPVAPDVLINAELHFPSAVTPAVTDPDGDNVTITRVTEPTLGILDISMLPQISYTPSQTGIDRLNYTASDLKGGTDTGTITIFINPDDNARPVLDHIYNTGGRVGVDLNFTVAAADDENDPLTFDLANVPDGASITAGGDFSWRPVSSQNGTHTVTFIVHDDSGGADWQHVLITILRADETNLPPVPQDINTTVVLGGGKGFQPDVVDPEGDMTEITRVYDSSLGDVDRSFTSQGIIVYIAGVLGNDEVIYTVSDGRGGFANGTISITVEEPANVRPLIDFVGDKSVNAGDELTFTVDAEDLDGFVTGFELEGETQGPSMSPQGIFSWTPTANDVGRHEFTILVFDNAGENSTVTITVTVRSEDFRNSPPVAPDVVIMTPQDVLSIVRPTLTDPDEGDPVRISQTGQTTKGRILSGFLRAGIIIYLPNQGETGTETIPYTIADSSDGNDTATINVFISARGNTDPILGSIYFRNINAGQQLAFDLEAEDPDGDAISYQTVGAPDGVEISPEGRLSWTPTAADVRNHTFTVIAYDDRGGADSKTAVIRVLPAGTANQAPDAPSSSVTAAAGGSVVITPAISDPDGDRVTITDAVADGTGVVIQSEDSINYIHVATTPTETITYTVTDARGATSTGTIIVQIVTSTS